MARIKFESNLDILRGYMGHKENWVNGLPDLGDTLLINTKKGLLRFEVYSRTWEFASVEPYPVVYVGIPKSLYKKESGSNIETLPKEWVDLYLK